MVVVVTMWRLTSHSERVWVNLLTSFSLPEQCSSVRVQDGHEGKGLDAVPLNEVLALWGDVQLLPEGEGTSYKISHFFTAPKVTIQDVTSELFLVLDVDQQPLVRSSCDLLSLGEMERSRLEPAGGGEGGRGRTSSKGALVMISSGAR